MKTIDPFVNIPRPQEPEGTMYGSQIDNLETLQAGAGDTAFRVDASGLWLGAEKFADAPFRVDMDGNVTMTSATISGYITVGGAASDINDHTTEIDGGKIQNETITNVKITDRTIEAPKIKAGTLTSNEIAANTIVAANIAAGTITGTEIAADTITASNIAADAITTSELAADAVHASNIAAGEIETEHLSANSVTADKIDVSYLSALSANLGTITAGTITGTTITGATIRTSSSGKRIELTSSDYVNVYDDYGVNAGRLEGYGNELWLRSLNSRNLVVSGDGNLQLKSQGVVYIDPDSRLEVLSAFYFDRDNSKNTSYYKLNMDSNDIEDIDELKGGDGYIDMNSGNGNTQTEHFDPTSSGTYNLGGSSRYWYYLNVHDVSYHSLGFYDDGVTIVENGKKKKVSDVEAIKRMKPHPKFKTKDGAPLLDKKSLPLEMFIPASDHNGKKYKRDAKTGYPIVEHYEKHTDKKGRKIKKKVVKVMPDADGESGAQLLALALGAIRELDSKIEALENELAQYRSK